MRFFLLLTCMACVWGQAPADPVVLTVGSEKITKSQFEQIIDTLPDQQKSMAQSPEGRRQLAERVAELKTLAGEARSRKLDQDPGVKVKIALQSDQVLASALYARLVDTPADEPEMRAYYDAHKGEYQETRARHILVRFQGSRVPVRDGQKDLTDAEALAKIQDLKAKIAAGAKFADVAKAESDDTGTGDQGGDLGPVTRGQTVPEFEQAAFSQPVGQVGDPVKTQFGYHLILVDSRDAKSFDSLKPQLAQQLKPELGQKSIDALVEKAGIKYDEDYFGKEK
jgi:peptidyl-prolyl cis-trans isomerase C